MHRVFKSFSLRDVTFRIACSQLSIVTSELALQRETLEKYIIRHPEFGSSFVPITPLPGAPEAARRMCTAARTVGVGPMAAVAGTMAELGCEAAMQNNAEEVIIDNGGDLFLCIKEPITIGLYVGEYEAANELCFNIKSEETPIAICSSSSRMGHSSSLGDCDLATVVSQDAALADAAATFAANCVHSAKDIEPALQKLIAINGVDGAIIASDGKFGMIGRLPEITRKS